MTKTIPEKEPSTIESPSVAPGPTPPQTEQGVDGDPRPVNGHLWGQWVAAGSDRWEVVRRSSAVFVRNTTELVDLLKVPATNIAFSLQLMSDDHQGSTQFWEELDQRLHNQLASAVSLVDHTRRLLEFYDADVPEMVAEYNTRNAAITNMNEAAFLRDLRNYLLHYGAPPIVQSLSLAPITSGRITGHAVKLSAAHLLKWDGWKARSRAYLSSFRDRDGPVLGHDVAVYANEMSQNFTWLFEQRPVVNNDARVLDRFRIGRGEDDGRATQR
jgi:hypothetical protein